MKKFLAISMLSLLCGSALAAPTVGGPTISAGGGGSSTVNSNQVINIVSNFLSGFSNVVAVAVTNVYRDTFMPNATFNTNSVMMSYTSTEQAFYQIRWQNVLRQTILGQFNDGEYATGVRWTAPNGDIMNASLHSLYASDDNFTDGTYTWYQGQGEYNVVAKAGTTITVTNNVKISSANNYLGTNYFIAQICKYTNTIVAGGGGGGTGTSIDIAAALNSGTNSAVLKDLTSTNQVNYFGNTPDSSTNREPYWVMSQGWGALGETHFALFDPEGLGIFAIENKNARRDRTFYFGGYTNRALGYVIGADVVGGSLPRMVWNFVESDGDTIRHQVALVSNCFLIGSTTYGYSVAGWSWDTSGNQTFGATNSNTTIKGQTTNSISITAAGFQRSGDYPFACLSGGYPGLATITPTPQIVTYTNQVGNQMNYSMGDGTITNIAAGMYEVSFTMPIGPDPIVPDVVTSKLYINMVAYEPSTCGAFIGTDQGNTINRTIYLYLAAGTRLDVRAYTTSQDFTEGGGVFQGSFSVKRL